MKENMQNGLLALAVYLPTGLMLLASLKDAFFYKLFIFWVSATLLFFFAQDASIFFIGLSFLCLFSVGLRDAEKPAIYLLLLPATHLGLSYPIEGIGGINKLFSIDSIRVLNLFILLPISLKILFFSSTKKRFFPADKPVFFYLLWTSALSFARRPTATDAIRQIFLTSLDLILPYYVFSRGVKDKMAFHKLFSAIFFSAFLLATMGVFESLIQRNIYREALVFKAAFFPSYCMPQYRVGMLRISTTLGHAIHYGYFLIIALASLVFLWPWLKKKNFAVAMIAYPLFLAILLLTFSRGPWVGATLFFLTWVSFLKLRQRTKIFIFFIFFLIAIAPVMVKSDVGVRIVSVLPYVGVKNQGEVRFRETLAGVGMRVALKSPWFGSAKYAEDEAFSNLKRPDGTVDFTNTFLWTSLRTGFVGLFFFMGGYVVSLFYAWKKIAANRGKDEVISRIGRTLLSALLAVLFVMSTTWGNIIQLYSVVLMGLCGAFINMLPQEERVNV